MKSVVFYVIVFAVVILSWGVFAQQRRVVTTTAPTQTTASIESRPTTSVQQTMEQCSILGSGTTR